MTRNDSTTTTKEIAAEDWVGWCDRFTNGNHGRQFNLEIIDAEDGDDSLAIDVPLVAIDYDPANKGNDFVVSYGQETAPSRHVIEAPVKLWQSQDVNGEVVSLEIEAANGRVTLIRFLHANRL